MSEYRITLPGTKAKAYNRISLIILVVNMLAFGLVFFKPGILAGYIAAVVMMFILSLTLFSYIGKNIKLQNKFTIVSIGLSAIAWIILGDYLLAVLMAAMAVVSYYTLQDPILIFSDDGIAYPSFPKRFYTWPQVKAAMIKEDVLTLDLQSNQLLQFTLPAETIAAMNVHEFNSFCRNKQQKS